jgi:hypothetical protein
MSNPNPQVSYGLSRPNGVLLTLLGTFGGIAMFSLGLFTLLTDAAHSIFAAALLTTFGFLAFVWTANAMRVKVLLSESYLEYSSFFARKIFKISDITSVRRSGARGTKNLAIRAPSGWCLISTLTVTNAELDEIEEFLYRRAELLGNTRIKRPSVQKSFSDYTRKGSNELKEK